jgi:hypothetical protein
MYFPTKRILGANVDNIEKMKTLASYKDGLLKDCRQRRQSVLKLKNKTKDILLSFITLEAQNNQGTIFLFYLKK